MAACTVEISEELAEVLKATGIPVQRAALEMILLELYRRGEVSSGWAARMLGMNRSDFIRYSGEKGIPYFQATPQEFEAERQTMETLMQRGRSAGRL